jgi:hypothetical protein
MPDPLPAHAARFMDGPLHVSTKNVFTDSSFVNVMTKRDRTNNQLILEVRFKPDAAQRFSQILRGQVPAGVDQLAVFLEGELIMSSVVLFEPDEVRNPTSIPIGLPVDFARSTEIEAAVAKRWPRRGT